MKSIVHNGLLIMPRSHINKKIIDKIYLIVANIIVGNNSNNLSELLIYSPQTAQPSDLLNATLKGRRIARFLFFNSMRKAYSIFIE
jgi:hypothetical protein